MIQKGPVEVTCRNCNGKGIVDGGTKVRIKKELAEIDNMRYNELSGVKERDKEKLKMIKKEIEKKYVILYKDKEKEFDFMKESKCVYCKGKGTKMQKWVSNDGGV